MRVLWWLAALGWAGWTAAGLTIAPSSCAPYGNCSAAIAGAISQCGPGCRLTLAPGVFPLLGGRGPRVTVADVPGLRLSGYGAVLSVVEIGGGLSFARCPDLVVAGITIDQPRPAFTAGVVASVSGRTVAMRVNQSAQPRPGQDWLRVAQAVLEFDSEAGRPAAGGLDLYTLDSPLPLDWRPGGLLMTMNASLAAQFKVGGTYVMRHQVYSYNAISFSELSRPRFVDLQLLSIPGMGIVGSGAEDLTIDNVRVYRSRGRLMSLTADAVHLTNAKGFVRIQNCLFEGQGDDGINIPTMYNSVLQRYNANSLGLGSRLNNTLVVSPSLAVNDSVLFRSRRSFEGYFKTRVASIDQRNFTVTFRDNLPPALALYDLVLSSSQQPDWILIQNNTFRNNRARGLLLKQHSALVQHNSFEGCSGPAIQAQPDGCYWFEGDTVHNWTVVNNRFVNNNYGAARQPGDLFVSSCVPFFNRDGSPDIRGHPPADLQPHSQVAIRRNYFLQFSTQAAVSATGVDGMDLEGNTVAWSKPPGPAGTFHTPTCVGVNITNNQCQNGPCKHTIARG